MHALVTGAAAEPELQTVLEEGHRRHVDGARTVVRMLTDLGAISTRIEARSAAETLAAISDFRFALLLRESYGWSLDHVETRMADASRALLLD